VIVTLRKEKVDVAVTKSEATFLKDRTSFQPIPAIVYALEYRG